jgi:hypothetical protein
MRKKKSLLNFAIVLAVIAVQLSTAVRVMADDSQPPEETPVATPTEDAALTETATPEADPTEELTPTETSADPTEEPTLEETATSAPEETETPASEETGTPAPEETAAPDPEETATPASGEAAAPEPECVPADSPEAAAQEGDDALPICQGTLEDDLTVPVSDPIWCPEGVTPDNDLLNQCTPAQEDITHLIGYLQDNSATYNGNGAIYFTTGVYAGPESMIVINYAALPEMGTMAVMGGWDLGDSNTHTAGDTTTFNVPVVVVWNSDVTLSDLVVAPASNGSPAVFVNTDGDITVTNVTTAGGFSGGELVNYGGSGGNVTVEDSTFNGAANTGLQVVSSGSVTLTGVVANGNRTGISVDNTRGTAGVTMENIFASGNAYEGVDVRSAGTITITTVTADDNIVGMYLDTTAGAGDIFVDHGSFTGDDSVGLKAVTGTGNITVQNVTTDSKNAPGSFGAWLKTYGGGTVDVSDSTFTNAGTGLFVVGTNDVTLSNVSASGNAGDGVRVEAGWVFACIPPDGINVSAGDGTLQNNGGYGITVYPGPNGTANLATTINYIGNTSGEYNIDLTKSCVIQPEGPSKPYQVVEISGQGDDPVTPDCETYTGVIMILPDQSRVKVTCPVNVAVTVAVAAEEDLPAAPPVSVTLVAGLVVTAGDENPLPDGGSVQMCFAIPEGMEGRQFAILYWDPAENGGAGGWIELPQNQFGGQVYPLHPDTPEDGMLILEGTYRCGNCVCARVNFTGTFILVAR